MPRRSVGSQIHSTGPAISSSILCTQSGDEASCCQPTSTMNQHKSPTHMHPSTSRRYPVAATPSSRLPAAAWAVGASPRSCRVVWSARSLYCGPSIGDSMVLPVTRVASFAARTYANLRNAQPLRSFYYSLCRSPCFAALCRLLLLPLGLRVRRVCRGVLAQIIIHPPARARRSFDWCCCLAASPTNAQPMHPLQLRRPIRSPAVGFLFWAVGRARLPLLAAWSGSARFLPSSNERGVYGAAILACRLLCPLPVLRSPFRRPFP